MVCQNTLMVYELSQIVILLYLNSKPKMDLGLYCAIFTNFMFERLAFVQ